MAAYRLTAPEGTVYIVTTPAAASLSDVCATAAIRHSQGPLVPLPPGHSVEVADQGPPQAVWKLRRYRNDMNKYDPRRYPFAAHAKTYDTPRDLDRFCRLASRNTLAPPRVAAS